MPCKEGVPGGCRCVLEGGHQTHTTDQRDLSRCCRHLTARRMYRLTLLSAIVAGSGALRILALHGGGDSADTMRGITTNLQNALGSGVTWYFAQAPYSPGLWIRDPPDRRRLGAGETTDPNWAALSFNELDNLVSTQGPFDGIMGYSQGAAMTILYLSHNAAAFRFAVTFCGYLTTTHTGLMGRVTAAAPIATPTVFWMGTADTIITNTLTNAAVAEFSNPTVLVANGLGHVVPESGSTFDSVVSFISGFEGGASPSPSTSPGVASPGPSTSPGTTSSSPPPPSTGSSTGSSNSAKEPEGEAGRTIPIIVGIVLGAVVVLALVAWACCYICSSSQGTRGPTQTTHSSAVSQADKI